MDAKEGLKVFNVVLEQIPEDQRAEFADGVRGLLPELGGAALTETVQEPTNEVETEAEKPEPSNPEQEHAAKLARAIAEKFHVDVLDFSLLSFTAETGETKHVVAYTARDGIDLGDPKQLNDPSRSWNSVFSKENAREFYIEIDGLLVDTRCGMTRDVYDTMVETARQNGRTLPDSLYIEHDEHWAMTLLTGEQTVDPAPVAFVHDSVIHHNWYDPRDDRRSIRFRPAVVLE